MLSGISCTGWHRFWQMITKIQIAFAQAYNCHCCCYFFHVGDRVLERSRERFSDQNEKSGLLLKRTEPMAPVLLLLSLHLPSKSRRGIRESFSFFCVLDRWKAHHLRNSHLKKKEFSRNSQPKSVCWSLLFTAHVHSWWSFDSRPITIPGSG